jgi:hypothetical protein
MQQPVLPDSAATSVGNPDANFVPTSGPKADLLVDRSAAEPADADFTHPDAGR